MKMTNKLNLPDIFQRAIERKRYSKGDSDYSVTELIAPAYQRKLMREHDADIEVDVSDSIWSIVGTALHSVAELAGSDSHLQEMRLKASFNGVTVSGGVDMLDPDACSISDLKVTSVWKIVNGGDYPDWTQQLNCYALLARAAGCYIKSLSVIALMRDWQKRRALEDGYPSCQVKVIPIEMWTFEKTLSFILSRIAAHSSNPEPCTAEERWQSATTYAVKKNDNKKALRVLNSQQDAENYILDVHDGKSKYAVEVRHGEARRCEEYCDVAQWCTVKGVVR